ncbi:Gag-Pol polyprotein, partial [Schistosoma japonicum]
MASREVLLRIRWEIFRVVDKSFNVDEYVASTDSVHDAVTWAEQLGSVLKKGDFRLYKWISNCLQVTESIPLEERVDARMLMLFQNTMHDFFTSSVNMPERTITRRGIHEGIASFYDPRGLSAVDVQITENERTFWFAFLEHMRKVENISFPRCMLAPDMDHSLIELHILCYVSDEKACCRLVLAKPRVAPLEVQTIPRLELTAVVLAAGIGSQLQTELDREFAEVVFWTDSAIVLNHIRNKSSQLKTFVANGVSTIRSLIK